MITKSYSEIRRLETLEERFDYLMLAGQVGERTFGSERWINQNFYTSREWRNVRNEVIARDLGCDLGVQEFPIFSKPHVHHMNPMSVSDIDEGNFDILNPEFLITVSHQTHNAIHYGTRDGIPQKLVERVPGDTKLWGKRGG